MNWNSFDAALFDLDGVITPTAAVHMRAWSDIFNAFLDSCEEEHHPYTDEDYYTHVDGLPRDEGVRGFLASRDIELPEGISSDAADALTVTGLGYRKDAAFKAALDHNGVTAYPGSVALLDALVKQGVQVAVVSSSKNARAVLEAADLADRFEVIVDGVVAEQEGLPGKPAPDTFLAAAQQLGVPRERTVVLEDAESGVAAGRAGGFGLVVGVDRGAGEAALRGRGADLVVTDLAELLP